MSAVWEYTAASADSPCVHRRGRALEVRQRGGPFLSFEQRLTCHFAAQQLAVGAVGLGAVLADQGRAIQWQRNLHERHRRLTADG